MSKSNAKNSGTPKRNPETVRSVKSTSKDRLPDSKPTEERKHKSEGELLDEEIRSKQRTLALLNRSIEGDAALQEQILLRDRRLEELNLKLVEAEARNKEKKEQSVGKLKEQIAKLENDLQTTLIAKLKNEEAIGQLRSEVAEWKAKAENEKESGELLNEALTEETEAVKAELNQKRNQVTEVKKDILQLSKIIQDMTKLNAELNAKIDTLNKETATMTSDYYAAVARAEHTEQLESDLAEYIASSQRLEKQVGRLNEALDKTHRNKLLLESTSREVQASLQLLTGKLEELSVSSTSNDPRVSQTAIQVSEELKSLRHKLKQVTPEEASKLIQELDENTLQIQVRELKAAIKEKDRQSDRYVVDINNLNRKLAKIESLHAKELADSQDSIDRAQKRSNVLLEQTTLFTERIDACRNELAKKDSELQRAQTQVMHLQGRIEDMKRKVRENDEKSASLEKIMKDQRAAIIKIQTERFEEEKQITIREKRTASAMTSLKALQEEIFAKDTEILKKSKEVQAMAGQLAELEAKIKALNAKLKTAATEGAEELVRQLEEKTRETEILKEMIRGSQNEVKLKEVLISRFKKRIEDSPASFRTQKATDDEIIQRIQEFISQVDKGESMKKAAKEKLLTTAIEKLQGPNPEQSINIRKLREQVGSEKFRSLLPADGVVTVSDLANSLRSWFS